MAKLHKISLLSESEVFIDPIKYMTFVISITRMYFSALYGSLPQRPIYLNNAEYE